MKDIQALIDLGFSEPEARMYIALYKLGGATAAHAAKEAGIQRTAAYATLRLLTARGAVQVYFKKNTRFYQPQKPEKISRMMESKLEAFNALIPSLVSLSREQAQVMGLRFIETREELRSFYEDILLSEADKTYRVIGNTIHWFNIDPEFFTGYRARRAKKKIKTRLLLTADSREVDPAQPALLRDVRYLPEGHPFKSTMNIFHDQAIIISPEMSSLAVVIKVPAMIDIFHSLFEIIWEMTHPDKKT